MIPPILTVCLSCSFLVYTSLAAPQPDPQRLAGGSPRPLALGSPASQGGAVYTQQLTFGGPPPQPSPAIPQQVGRVRIPQNQPIVLQQSALSAAQGKPQQFALQSFPGLAAARQQQQQQQQAVNEDEYDDEEYEEDPQGRQQQQQAASPSPRPVQQQQQLQQRGQQIRVSPQPQSILQLQQQQLQAGPGPQRFVVPQQQAQPQPTPQQIRRPVQQRVIPQQQQVQPQQQQQLQQPQLQQYQTRQPSQQQFQQTRQNSPGQDSRLKNRVSTPPPVQTINRFMRNNPDGSITWGYENEDGTFKEETLGADCVVKGKYGYIDPDGTKREYEYQQGNPCDPSKRGQEEEEDALSPNSQQKLGGILTARPGQQQRPRPLQQQIYQQ